MRSLSDLFYCFYVLLLSVLVYAGASATVSGTTPTGTWEKLKDLNDKNVIELAKAAVAKFNEVSNPKFELVRILDGEVMHSADGYTHYKLDLLLQSDFQQIEYGVTVKEKSSSDKSFLTLFKRHHIGRRSSDAAARDHENTRSTGKWEKINNLKEKKVIENAEFAVEAINFSKKSKFKLVRVLEGVVMHDGDTDYHHFILLLQKGSTQVKYEVNVVSVEAPPRQQKTLTSFQPHFGASSAAASDGDNNEINGEWEKITNFSGKNVIAAAEYATESISNQTKADPRYKLVRVLSGELMHLGDGYSGYHLILLLQKGSTSTQDPYEVLVAMQDAPSHHKLVKFFKSSLTSFHRHTGASDDTKEWEKITNNLKDKPSPAPPHHEISINRV